MPPGDFAPVEPKMHQMKFHQNLVESPKFSVRYLARITENDMTTVMGNNLYSILKKCNLEGSQIDRLTPGFVKKNIRYQEAPVESAWMVNLAEEVMNIRNGNSRLDGFSTSELDELLQYVCTS